MRNLKGLFAALFLSIALSFSLCQPVRAQTPPPPEQQVARESRLVIGEQFNLHKGEVLNGDLVVIGGSANVQQGATVNGDVDLLGGNLQLGGEVVASINAVGASIQFEEGAVVRGDVHAVASSLTGIEKATIYGSVNTIYGGVDNAGPSLGTFFSRFSQWRPQIDWSSAPFNFFQRTFIELLRTLAMALLALLVALLLPRPLDRVSQTLVAEPFLSGGLGLLTMLVAPAVLVVLMITILLIPVALAGIIVLGMALILGWIAAGYELGNRLAEMFKTTWTPPLAASLGTLVLGLALYLLGFVFCLGGLIGFLIACWGLGAVLLSRFGTQVYRTSSPTRVTVPSPVSPSTETSTEENHSQEE